MRGLLSLSISIALISATAWAGYVDRVSDWRTMPFGEKQMFVAGAVDAITGQVTETGRHQAIARCIRHLNATTSLLAQYVEGRYLSPSLAGVSAFAILNAILQDMCFAHIRAADPNAIDPDQYWNYLKGLPGSRKTEGK